MALGAVDADIDLIELDYDVVVTVRANYRLGYFRCGHPNSRKVGVLSTSMDLSRFLYSEVFCSCPVVFPTALNPPVLSRSDIKIKPFAVFPSQIVELLGQRQVNDALTALVLV